MLYLYMVNSKLEKYGTLDLNHGKKQTPAAPRLTQQTVYLKIFSQIHTVTQCCF